MEAVAEAMWNAHGPMAGCTAEATKRKLKVCLDAKGPGFADARDSRSPLKLRISRQLLLTIDSLNEFFRCLILEKGQVRTAVQRHHGRVAAGGNMFAGMLPASHRTWGKIVDFIVDSEFAKDRISAYIAEEHERDEWRSLSIDGTSKLANVQNNSIHRTDQKVH